MYMLTHTPPQVWYIPQTGEVFITYEDYLNRYISFFPFFFFFLPSIWVEKHQN